MRKFLFLTFAVWCALGAPGVVHAALQISICGHSTYDCESGSDDNYGWGDQTPIGSEVQASQICNEDKSKCLTVPNNSNNLGPTPAGWSSPTQPPSTAGAPTTKYWGQSVPSSANKVDTVQEVCDIWNAANPGAAGLPSYPYSSNGGVDWICLKQNGFTAQSVFKSQDCPAGYTNSSGTCTLSNASAVQKPVDGKCTILRSGNTFSGDANDADCSVSSSNSPAQTLNLGGSGTAGINASKDGYSGAVTNNTADGSTTITFSVPNYSNGTTTQFTLSLGAPDGTGKQVVVGISKNTSSGIGTGNDPNAKPDMEAQCGVAGKPPCTMKIDETGTPTDSSLSTEKDAFEAATDARTTAMQGVGTVSDLGLGFTITWPTSGCSDLTFSMPGGKGNLVVPWCEKQADIKNAGGWFIGVLTAFGLFSIGVGALRNG